MKPSNEVVNIYPEGETCHRFKKTKPLRIHTGDLTKLQRTLERHDCNREPKKSPRSAKRR